MNSEDIVKRFCTLQFIVEASQVGLNNLYDLIESLGNNEETIKPHILIDEGSYCAIMMLGEE